MYVCYLSFLIGVVLKSRDGRDIDVEVNGVLEQYVILEELKFSSDRKRMSVAVRNKNVRLPSSFFFFFLLSGFSYLDFLLDFCLGCFAHICCCGSADGSHSPVH